MQGAFSTIIEELEWRCPERNCRKFASLRIGSVFEGSNLQLLELLEFVFLWEKDIQSTEPLVENIGWATATITNWKIFMRDRCVERYLINSQPIGGPGEVVEIDGSMIGGR